MNDYKTPYEFVLIWVGMGAFATFGGICSQWWGILFNAIALWVCFEYAKEN